MIRYLLRIIHKEFVPEGRTKAKLYLEVLERILQRIHGLRPDFHVNKDWFLDANSAPAHTVSIVQRFPSHEGLLRSTPTSTHHLPSLDLAGVILNNV
jgi:hypothetical protein